MALVSGGFSGNIPTFDRRATSGVFDLDEQKYLREQGLWGKYPWDITQARYYGKNLGVTATEAAPTTLFIRADGLKLYVLGTNQDAVDQYTLSTAWDISTATYDNITVAVGGAAPLETAPQAMHFSPDGTRLYTLGSGIDTIEQYNLSVPWDVSSAVKTKTKLANNEASPTGLYFKEDGTKAYITGNTNRIYRYSLTTPWEVNTLVYDGNATGGLSPLLTIAPGFTGAYGLTFKPDGSSVFVTDVASHSIHEFTLPTPWDIDVLSYSGRSFKPINAAGVTGQNPIGPNFSPDGLYMYIAHQNTDTIYQFEMF